MLIYTVINATYMRLGLGWGRQVQKVSGRSPVFVCADDTSFSYLQAAGFHCLLRTPATKFSNSDKTIFDQSTFPNDDAAYTVSLKFAAAEDWLQQGRAVLFSDVDAIWLNDPLSDLASIEFDIAAQAGSFPPDAKAAWGFALCTGFFAIRPSSAAIQLVAKTRAGFDGSDQRTLNRILLRDDPPNWESRPKAWEHGRIDDGWTDPVAGVTLTTGLRLVVLPHAYYQRHGTRGETCHHALVCHPNSPKAENGKLEVLAGLGINLMTE